MADHNGLNVIPILLGVVGLLALAGGIAGIVGGLLRGRRERRARESHRAATGRIVDRFIPSGSSTRTEGPQYTIDFTAADGEVVRFVTDSVGWSPGKVGDKVDLLYNPAESKDVFVRGGERTAAYLLGIGGVIFTIVGLLMALSALDLARR